MSSRPAIGDRSGFSRLTATSYLAHAAVAPLADDVLARMQEGLAEQARAGVASIGPFVEWANAARDGFARLVGAAPDQVARVPSTSAGVAAIATGLRLAVGERILCFDGEFPTNVSPWQAAAARAGAHVDLCPLAPFERSHAEGLELVARRLAERPVRLVAVSAVQFQTGLALPVADLARLAHEHGARLFVDGIQAVGAVPLDVVRAGVDYLACGAHKWLMGPLGAAYLYLSPAARAELEPQIVGWMSHSEPDAFLFAPNELRYDRALDPGARVFEQGVLPFVQYAGSAVAIANLLELGVPRIHAHLQAFHDALEPQLARLGWRSRRSAEAAGRSGICSFAPPDGIDVGTVVAAAAERGVALTGPDGLLRVAPHWPNGLGEVDAVVDVLAGVVRG
ncbi:Isopenicillin N epimerase [Planctomycetes bacterium Pla163]|uniref:Isopenicillin N epimerase n=1 Tax=Rohdeia mirabilis TaxID=2528008 RepID=A0A518CYC4_9BACT|nr:Isopenicillin N epimerase [Planctomycetes bacterium Pla163]